MERQVMCAWFLLGFATVILRVSVRVSSQRNGNGGMRNTWHGHFFSVNSGGFGDYCNVQQNLPCDTKALLFCHNQVCTCIEEDEMIFDVAKGQCVAKAGAKCFYGRDEMNPNPNGKTGKIPCVLNGFCGKDGICGCVEGFFNSFNVTCLPQKGFDLPCHFDVECRADYHLRCIAGICGCDPNVSVKHPTYELCLGLAGEKAIEGNCVEFSERVQPILGLGKGDVLCECMEGFRRGRDKRCHGDVDQFCTVESPCVEGFACVQGTCRCPFPDYQIYSSNENRCLSRAFGPCNSSADCAPGSFCNSSGFYSKCDCRPGFVLGTSRHCEKSFGTPCHISRGNGRGSKVGPMGQEAVVDECCSSSLLQCRDGKCICADLKRFSEQEEKCVGLVGSICFKSDAHPMCVNNSECVPKYERLGFGLCTCVPGFLSNEIRECVPEPVLPTEHTKTTDAFTRVSGHEDSDTVTLATSTTTRSAPKLNTAQIQKNVLEFYKFLNDTLYGGFDNASFARFMNENFNLPE